MFAIALATVADVERLAPLFDAYRQFYGLAADLPLARQYLLDRLTHEEALVLLAQAPDGAALGFVQMYPSYSSLKAARIYVLYDLYVASDARRGGVGRRLMAAAASEAHARGAVALTLSTARTNLPAQRLYESLGWRRDDEFVEYGLEL
jgi:ribosomal protein S18 acetylase RimI-like enzyme